VIESNALSGSADEVSIVRCRDGQPERDEEYTGSQPCFASIGRLTLWTRSMHCAFLYREAKAQNRNPRRFDDPLKIIGHLLWLSPAFDDDNAR
jgi:hypothetical protein